MATNPYAVKPLTAGMAGGAPLGQKSVNPLPGQQPVQRMGFDDFQKGLGYSLTDGSNNRSMTGTMNALAQFGGNPGAFKDTTYQFENSNEGGTFMDTGQGKALDPAFLEQLRSGGYGFEIDKSGRHPEARMYDAQGNMLGRQFSVGNTGSKFDNFMEKAMPVALAALGGATFGGFIPGAEIGAAGAAGGAAPAIGNGAFLGEGVASGIPAWDASVSLAGAGGSGGLAAMPGFEAAPLPGGESFGFQNVGAAAQDPFVFNAAADSQLASSQLGITGGQAAAAATAPATVNLGSLGGTMGTAGGISGSIAAALADPANALKTAGSSVLDFAKKNPQLAALGASGIAQLAGGSPDLPKLPGSGGGSGGAGGVNTPLAGALEQQIGSMGAPDYSGVFGLKNTAGDPNTLNQEAIDAAYSQQTRMLDPQFAREKQAMEARLAEQGFVPGTPGYERAMSIFGEERTKAYGSARDSSIMQGYQIGQGDFRNRLSDTELNNSASRESLAQTLAKRNQPFNELASIKGNQQIDYNNQLDRYNAEVSSSNSRNQALSQLALALGMYLG